MSELQLKDRKILYELEKNARQSNRAIAKKVGLNVDVVRYRINKLVERGVIHGFLTFVNFANLGYTDYGVFFSTQHLTKDKEQEIVNYLSKHNNVSYFSKVGGKFDFIVGILAKNIVHFNSVLKEVMKNIGTYILTKDIATRVVLKHYPKTYLYEKKSKDHLQKYPYFGGEYGEEKLDDLDKKILQQISTNARITTIELSKMLNKPASTIALRIKKLQERKIIVGFFCFTSPQNYGYQAYDVTLNVKNMSEQDEKRLLSFFEGHPNIIYSIKCVGKWDYEVMVEVPNQEKFQQVLAELKEKFSGVIQSLEFVTMFKDLKYSLFPF